MDELSKIIAEGNALTRALAVIEEGGPTDEARQLCLGYFAQHATTTLENCVIDCALRKICGLPSTTYTVPQVLIETRDSEIFRQGACKWLQWANGATASDFVRSHKCHTARDVVRSALDIMVLHNWVEAVDNLIRGDLQNGRRYFRRATVLGAEYGTASNPVIQWTFAASFFPPLG